MPRLAHALFAVLGLATSDARAEVYSLPVYITVVGTGSVRLLVSAGDTVPCDSSGDVRLVDGWVSAGQTLALQSPWPCICEQHTTGAFRETNFTPPQMVCQQINPFTGVPYPYLTMTVSTDG